MTKFFIYFSSLQYVPQILPFNPPSLNSLRVFSDDYKLWGAAILRNILTLIPARPYVQSFCSHLLGADRQVSRLYKQYRSKMKVASIKQIKENMDIDWQKG